MVTPIIATIILASPLGLAVTEDVGSILPQLQQLISVNDTLVHLTADRMEREFRGAPDSGRDSIGGNLINVDFRRRTKLGLVLENSSSIRIHEIISVNSHRQGSITFQFRKAKLQACEPSYFSRSCCSHPQALLMVRGNHSHPGWILERSRQAGPAVRVTHV